MSTHLTLPEFKKTAASWNRSTLRCEGGCIDDESGYVDDSIVIAGARFVEELYCRQLLIIRACDDVSRQGRPFTVLSARTGARVSLDEMPSAAGVVVSRGTHYYTGAPSAVKHTQEHDAIWRRILSFARDVFSQHPSDHRCLLERLVSAWSTHAWQWSGTQIVPSLGFRFQRPLVVWSTVDRAHSWRSVFSDDLQPAVIICCEADPAIRAVVSACWHMPRQPSPNMWRNKHGIKVVYLDTVDKFLEQHGALAKALVAQCPFNALHWFLVDLPLADSFGAGVFATADGISIHS